MKVDTTPPVDNGRTITIPSRYITDSQYVSAWLVGYFISSRETKLDMITWY